MQPSKGGRPAHHTYQGVPTSTARLAEMAGVAQRKMVRRLAMMTAEDAVVLEPIAEEKPHAATGRSGGRHHLLHGRACSVSDLAWMAGCSYETMRARLDHGRSPEEAVGHGAGRHGGYKGFEWRGARVTDRFLADLVGCSLPVMYKRLQVMTPEAAVAMESRSQGGQTKTGHLQDRQQAGSPRPRGPACP